MKLGDNPINILSDMSSAIQAPDSADKGAIASVKSSDTQTESFKPMDEAKKMVHLEDMIKNKEADLMALSKKIESLADEWRALVKLPESSRDGLLLKSIDDDLPDMRKRKDKDRLATGE